jgi:hypothetical protein
VKKRKKVWLPRSTAARNLPPNKRHIDKRKRFMWQELDYKRFPDNV